MSLLLQVCGHGVGAVWRWTLRRVPNRVLRAPVRVTARQVLNKAGEGYDAAAAAARVFDVRGVAVSLYRRECGVVMEAPTT